MFCARGENPPIGQSSWSPFGVGHRFGAQADDGGAPHRSLVLRSPSQTSRGGTDTRRTDRPSPPSRERPAHCAVVFFVLSSGTGLSLQTASFQATLQWIARSASSDRRSSARRSACEANTPRPRPSLPLVSASTASSVSPGPAHRTTAARTMRRRSPCAQVDEIDAPGAKVPGTAIRDDVSSGCERLLGLGPHHASAHVVDGERCGRAVRQAQAHRQAPAQVGYRAVEARAATPRPRRPRSEPR